MEREAIVAMLKELKAIFIKECMEDPEASQETRNRLVEIVQKHIERDKWQQAAKIFCKSGQRSGNG